MVCGSPDGWVFGLFDWQELILSINLWELTDYSFGLQLAGELIAVMPLQLDARSGAMGSSGWGGTGPIMRSDIDKSVRSQAIDLCIKQSLNISEKVSARHFGFQISPVTDSSLANHRGVNPFIFNGLNDKSGVSQVINLSASIQDLWSNTSQLAKRKINKAKQLGYTATLVNWWEHIDEYYRLHQLTYERTKVAPHPKNYFAGIANLVARSGCAFLMAVVDRRGKIVAFHNTASFHAGSYYHTGCSDPDAMEDGVNYLAFWEAISAARARGSKWYDCGAIFPGASENEKQKGLTLFKTKFGGQPHRLFAAGIDLVRHSSYPTALEKPASFLNRFKEFCGGRLWSFTRCGPR